jgi:DNA-directed RNA polymerase specialized sigma24 family protein
MLFNGKIELPEFAERFARCHSLLYFVASRILTEYGDIEEAVKNCFVVAARQPARFDSEGAFRSWLVRTLLHEAVQILHRKKRVVAAPALELAFHGCC